MTPDQKREVVKVAHRAMAEEGDEWFPEYLAAAKADGSWSKEMTDAFDLILDAALETEKAKLAKGEAALAKLQAMVAEGEKAKKVKVTNKRPV